MGIIHPIMDLLPHLLTYFRGERFNGVAMTVAGVVFLTLALLVWKQAAPASMARGLVLPLCFLTFAGLGGGPYFWWSGAQRLERFPQELRNEPSTFLEQESARMAGVNRIWLPLKITWTVLLVIGAFLAFRGTEPLWKGLGLGLILIGAMGHVVDGFASDRAQRYTAHLTAVISG